MLEYVTFSVGGDSESGPLFTTEMYSGSSGAFTAGANLKDDIGRSEACLAKIDTNSFVITGGATDSGNDKGMIRHDIDTGAWIDLLKPSVGRKAHICGHNNGLVYI